MLKTPEIITRQFGIEASAGEGRAIARVLLAFKGTRQRRKCKDCTEAGAADCTHTVIPGKAEFLSTVIPMVMKKVLPEFGGKRKFYRDVTQAAMGAAAGFKSRSTFTRRVSRFAAIDMTWSGSSEADARRQNASQRERGRAKSKGKKESDRPRKTPRAEAVLIHRQRRFTKPNVYGYQMPETRVDNKPDDYYPPTLADLLEDPATSPFFDAQARGFKSWDSFKDVPQWLWDSRLPLSHIERLVMTYYFMAGLGSKDDAGKMIGEVHPKQETIQEALGISRRTIYKANKRLAAIGLIRVFHPEPRMTPDGLRRGPAGILYLPIRTLTTEEATSERTRYAKCLARLRTQREEQRAAQCHRELLDAWTGKEHSMAAFWNELRRRLRDADIGRADIDLLVPRSP